LPQACRRKKKTDLHCVNATTRNVKRAGLGAFISRREGKKFAAHCGKKQQSEMTTPGQTRRWNPLNAIEQ
jgi:hypothetical protein